MTVWPWGVGGVLNVRTTNCGCVRVRVYVLVAGGGGGGRRRRGGGGWANPTGREMTVLVVGDVVERGAGVDDDGGDAVGG